MELRKLLNENYSFDILFSLKLKILGRTHLMRLVFLI